MYSEHFLSEFRAFSGFFEDFKRISFYAHYCAHKAGKAFAIL